MQIEGKQRQREHPEISQRLGKHVLPEEVQGAELQRASWHKPCKREDRGLKYLNC